MKCIRCGHDSKYNDRSNRRCPGCQKPFAFEPNSGDPVSDMLFHNAIQAVSGEGRVHWGVEHLYYEVCRRMRGKTAALIGAFVMLLVTIIFFVVASQYPVLFIVGVVAIFPTCILFANSPRALVRMSLETFNHLWKRWLVVHGKPARLIERAPTTLAPGKFEADIGDYSFDRAVICDRARTVDLLVANNFHFENNCAVLSIDGYPKGPFAIVRQMLHRNPRLQVFVIHDCTPNGCQVATKLLADPEWFGGRGLRIIDLGLRPRHKGPFYGLYLEADGWVTAAEGINWSEAKWLSKYRLELAAVRPEQVLKRLFAGLQAHANDPPTTGDSSGGVTDCGAFDADGYGGGDADSGAGVDGFG